MSFSEAVTSSTLAGNLSTHNSTADGSRMEWGALSVVSMVIFTLTFLLGVPGNGLVIWVTGFKMKSKVHTVCFLNLALADLIYCLTVPFRMANFSLIYSGLQRKMFAKSKKPVRLIFTVVVTFMICWIPNTVRNLVSIFTPIPLELTLFTIALASFNSALNPLLYVFAGHEFQQVFRRSILASLELALAEQRMEFVTRTQTPKFTSSTNV
ncbi:formyl peptide receptor-related sequence 3-like [Hypanus sabinus]|uniref:formyl peptide receptor-related sequence 3-like n=1 Tax=Hypanus sabinus TaxID=79690 RepID=UPI0028C3807D|nr:formyl peptide receptor-related sequence 3-like [Hypanus sabinus]